MPKKKAGKTKAVKKKTAPKPKKSAAKKSVRKASAKAAPRKRAGAIPLAPKAPPKIPGEKFLGEVEDFFGQIFVIALTLKEALSVGDAIHVKGHTTDFAEAVKSMQIDHKAVKTAKRGDGVGIKVGDKARKGDYVYRVG